MPNAPRSTPAPGAPRPAVVASGSRFMRFYGARRRPVFVVASLVALALYAPFAVFRWDAPLEYGYWLRQLFVMRGYARGDLGVEIVAFDKSFDAGAYAPGVVEKSKTLSLFAKADGVRFDLSLIHI